jgi:PPOX class probable FMN-dependent enzyme
MNETATIQWYAAILAALADAEDDPTARFAQLATVDAAGQPYNRTVVVRKLNPDAGDLLVVTDARSEKVAHLRAGSPVALCWYIIASRRQFRVRGTVTIVSEAGDPARDADRAARRAAWDALSDHTRRQFVWPEPGAPRAEPEAFAKAAPGDTPPAAFVLLIIHPNVVDHLDLTTTPHRRMLHRRRSDGRWETQSINP